MRELVEAPLDDVAASASSLAASGTTVIRFRARLPANTDNTAQGQTLSFTLTLNAIHA